MAGATLALAVGWPVLERRVPPMARLARWLRAPVRRWRLRGGAIAPRSPIVLLHGLGGFDQLPFGSVNASYFRGLERLFERHGVRVFRTTVPAFGTVDERGHALAVALRELTARTGAQRFNLIAHSMGGLDARYALAHEGIRPLVASLVTIGTPHRGTPIADLGSSVLGTPGVAGLLARLGVPTGFVKDMSSAALAAFNARVPDARGVFYASVVGRAPAARVAPPLAPVAALLARGGDSDGVVPTASQAWGVVLASIEADHWGEIGWSSCGDIEAQFTTILRELRARGL
ncbi:MAG: hypothetical protein A2138_12345 [Deltaproteobacteria bacterium RBG_16_71_12]|nr:MAG: hypothetical protein A2138_12345 [Deltaproteobacteria bacterium RBG_16_71_12]